MRSKLESRQKAISDIAALRAKAEQVLARRADAVLPVAETDVRRQLQELEVNKIELEMQNSALIALGQDHFALEQNLERFTELYDLAPAAYFILSKDGIVQEANLIGAKLLGQEREVLPGTQFKQFVSVTSRAVFGDFMQQIFAKSGHQSCDLELTNRHGGRWFAQIEANADQALRTCRFAVVDITARRRSEEAIRHSQQILTIAQRVAHVGSWEMDIASREMQFSDELFRILGHLPQAVEPNMQFIIDRVHPEDLPLVESAIRGAIVDGESFHIEMRIVRPDGAVRHVLSQGEAINNHKHEAVSVVGSLLDITERKCSEDALRRAHDELDVRVNQRTAELLKMNQLLTAQIAERESVEAALRHSHQRLRELSMHQELVKENERKRIAREIHDDLGQNMLALRIDVSMLHARTAHSHPRLHEKTAVVLNNIDATIKSVRAIMNNLRPAVLDLGLRAAFEWQVVEFIKRSGTACALTVEGADADIDLTEEIAIALFRILQESLSNVIRHAVASKVDIVLRSDAGWLSMTVSDNGVGMRPGCRRKSNSFGLVGMQERVSALGGELLISSLEDEKGTVLKISIPIKNPPY